MAKEIETKILDVDPDFIIKWANQHLNIQKPPRILYKTWIYDTANNVLKDYGRVLRLRKEGIENWLVSKGETTYIDGVKTSNEYSVKVDNLEETHQLLLNIGFFVKLEINKYRTTIKLEEGVELVIDEYIDDYSFIPPFIEIEAPSKEKLIYWAEFFGYTEENFCSFDFYQLTEYYKNK